MLCYSINRLIIFVTDYLKGTQGTCTPRLQRIRDFLLMRYINLRLLTLLTYLLTYSEGDKPCSVLSKPLSIEGEMKTVGRETAE